MKIPGRTLAFLALVVGLAACTDSPTSTEPDPPEDPLAARTLGVMQITVSGITTPEEMSAGAWSVDLATLVGRRAGPGGMTTQDLLPVGEGEGTGIQLEPISTGSFTLGERGNGGVRYLSATFRVRNADSDGLAYGDPLENLTFLAVSTEGTLEQTAVSNLRRFDGSLAPASLAIGLHPTGSAWLLAGTLESNEPDVLQVFTEEEAADVEAPAGVTSVLPYGFIGRNVDGGRTLPGGPAEDQFDGVVTFAFRLPLEASAADDPFEISVLVLAVADAETRLTQSFEEATPEGRAAFEARAADLGATTVTLLRDLSFDGAAQTRVVCDARVAGPAGNPVAVLAPLPGGELDRLVVVPPGQTLDGCVAGFRSGEATSHTAGVAFEADAFAVNQFGDILETFDGDASVTTDDPQGDVPATVSFAAGVATIGATLRTAGAREVFIGAAAATIPIIPAELASIEMVVPQSVLVFPGQVLSVVMQVFDEFGNERDDIPDLSSSEPSRVEVAGETAIARSSGWTELTATAGTFSVNADLLVVFSTVSVGFDHSCALRDDEEAYCWGSGFSGRLGNGSTSDSSVPVLVSGGHKPVLLGAGRDHTCVVTVTGEAYCWGVGEGGKLGNGSTSDSSEPVLVLGGHEWALVSGGRASTCGVTVTGAAYCWGSGESGQLGNGLTSASSVPVPVSGEHAWAVVSGGFTSTCGVNVTGEAYCWGDNDFGQLGNDDDTNQNSAVPVLVSGELEWALVSAGGFTHACGVTRAGGAFCWGRGPSGELGNNSTALSRVPVQEDHGFTWLR